jgi:plasmid stability protein
MADVVVHGVDDEVVERLRLKAELHGRALEDEPREILRRAAPLSPEAKVALADRIRGMTPRPLATDSADLIREDRDTR